MALEHPWTEPPAPAQTIDVAPGVRWLRMPLPFQLDHINLWLLADGDGWTAVDTGVALPPTRERWEQLFAHGLEGRPIRRVLVTHFHPDHIGNASWLTERWNAELWCTQTEWLAAEYALRSRDDADLDRRVAHYRRHGIAEEHTAQMRARGNHYPGLVGGLPFRFMPIADAETVTIDGRRWRVITARGHSPEHACLWCEDLRVLIAGDQVLPRITTNVSVWPERPRENPLRYYLDSLARFLRLPGDTLVLPSHGLPFRGLHHRLSTLVQHHDARLAEAADALIEPKTGAELIPVLFRRELDTHQLGFAIGETLAHLNFLEAEGRAVRELGRDGIERFPQALKGPRFRGNVAASKRGRWHRECTTRPPTTSTPWVPPEAAADGIGAVAAGGASRLSVTGVNTRYTEGRRPARCVSTWGPRMAPYPQRSRTRPGNPGRASVERPIVERAHPVASLT